MISVLYVNDEPLLPDIRKLFPWRIGNFFIDTCTFAPEEGKRLEQASFNVVPAIPFRLLLYHINRS